MRRRFVWISLLIWPLVILLMLVELGLYIREGLAQNKRNPTLIAPTSARVFIGRASFPTPQPDEFYWVDLIGLAVFNRDAQPLGRVVGLLDTGPHSVLRVVPEAIPAGVSAQEAERLIPFVAAYVDDVDLEQGRITVDWGLDY